MGRPPIDAEALMVKIMYDAPKGLNHEQMAKYLGINRASYYDLKAKNSDFSDVIKHYMKVSPIEVLKAFKSIAVGFSYDEVKKELRKDKQSGDYKLVVTEVVTKHVAPNATAGIFYLKNQMPNEFRDKVETAHSFEGGMENVTIVIKGKDGQ